MGLSKGSEGQVVGSEGQPEESEGFEGQLGGSEGAPEGSESQPWGWTDGRTYIRTGFLPILQDFVPSQGRCPSILSDLTASKQQREGTADHIMLLEDWL